uniref:Cilia- and flagella-associated protein 299 n=1 Tax=Polytomella parva TaxID=51329 RepID=A0A7S0VHL9_9CHLO|mmetsp:Transcript_388/g.469  ORF Transcript_388/g.469 Transcript_388/m.469 type:complete len:238 (+) Transcript_388:174-887(+)|eukprot:CAMPEP_0175039050 /NCGR_PEP_ID=MMETSP0052_2-20121109/291_1 /TAXON_ID=51329 ORGANISM="Polytomella parva, Strain SAG 63-3" /NCGR_SAMPLE_ID=MMETSP0052_2 /ASSEMBLY_ACC=CAM_ASM_000194 /LENGTH=237 /DNA_ID=CAMNT_0016300705 /DNA_START=154 /DNA_END=867 /DNA_ORIENTATION=-
MDDDLEIKGPSYDPIADEFATYEDYLDSQITSTDMYYLEDVELARHLVELCIRGNGEVIKREEFESRKDAAEAARQARLNKKPKKLASQGKVVEDSPLLQALKDREEAVRNGKLATIIFLRDKNSKGQEVSGYIDYGHRLKSESFEIYFDRKKRLMPKPSDLSFYNWETQMSTSNPTPSFQVMADNEAGLLFKNKRDRKVINVDPRMKPGDNSIRTELSTGEYLQVVLYDHVTRRRS